VGRENWLIVPSNLRVQVHLDLKVEGSMSQMICGLSAISGLTVRNPGDIQYAHDVL